MGNMANTRPPTIFDRLARIEAMLEEIIRQDEARLNPAASKNVVSMFEQIGRAHV